MGMAVKEKDTHIDDNEIDFPAFILNLQILLLQSLVIALQILCLHHRVNFKTMKKLLQSSCQVYPGTLNILINYLTVE